MRLVRCPACQTVFRLQPEQLRAHGGMVRCGHCFTLFDARENFVDTAIRARAVDAPEQAAHGAAATPTVSPPDRARTEDIGPPPEALFVLEDAGRSGFEPPAVASSDTGTATPLESDPGANPEHRSGESDTRIDPLDFGVPNDFHRPPLPESSHQQAAKEAPDAQRGQQASPPAATLFRRQRRGTPPDPPSISTDEQALGAPPARRTSPPVTAYWPALDEPVPATRTSKPETPAEAAEREALERAQRMRERTNSIVGQDRSDDTASRIEPRFNPHARTTAERVATERHQPDAEPVPPTPAITSRRTEPIPTHTDEAAESADEDAPFVISPNRYAPVESPPAGGASRGLQGVTIGVLLGLLGAQSAYLFRDEITRQWPELRPRYLETCARLGCDLPLPRDASLIDIETSDLEIEPANPSRYTLNAVVRNRAHFPQQPPHLELTLTDSRDRPVVRRVVTPQEWLAGPEALATGLAPASSQLVRLSFETSGIGNAVGYRIYAFFP
ncbi:MAG TPA: DUF3426 domain-containing protein [Rhodocyclaceae bacterium]|nr:DUF3426 domain-containing protein [Rhodocyclaceae bacterium]